MNVTIEVAGLKDVLREINQIDRKARLEITRNFKKIGAPVVNEAKANVPQEPPISGWGRAWKTKSGFQMLPWNGDPATKLIDVKVSGKKPREFNDRIYDLAVLAIRWRGTVNTLFDLASDYKTPQGRNMVAGLNREHGRASRVMWPAWERKGDEIEDAIKDEIERIMLMVNRNINRDTL